MSHNITRAEQDAIDRIIRNNNKNGNNSNPYTSSNSSNNNNNPYTSSSNRKNTSNPYFSGNNNNNDDDDDVNNREEYNNGGDPTNPSNAVAQIDRVSQDNVAKLKRALQYSNQSNEIADDTSNQLAKQKETIERSVAVSEDTKNILSMTKKTLRDMKLTAFKEKMIKFGIVGALIFIIIMIIYFKFLKRNNS